MSSTDNYLLDVLPDLLAKANEAKASYSVARDQMGDAGSQFEAGRALAYYEVVSYLIGQLDAFGIERSSVRVPLEFDAEHELL